MSVLVEIQDEILHEYATVDQLFYENQDDFVWLYDHESEPMTVGACRVWFDSEMDDREYIIINNEIIYLDTLDTL